MTVNLTRVQTKDDIRQNVRRFTQSIDLDFHRVVSLAQTVLYWVYDADDDVFGPNIFVGYERMTFDRYNEVKEGNYDGVKFDGAVARKAIEDLLGKYVVDEALADRLKNWLEELVGEDAVEGVNVNKWAVATLQSRKYWAFCCNPKFYDGLAACQQLDEITWTNKDTNPHPGDRCIIWQTKDREGKRGVIGIGEITHAPEELGIPEMERPYCRGQIDEVAMRNRIRLLRAPKLPLWETEYSELLSNLSVARAHGGTVFHLEREQWLEIQRKTDAPCMHMLRRSNSGQGRQSDVHVREVVELYAQHRAEEYFIEQGYQVTDVSLTKPYDLLCKKDGEELHVEVKGTQSVGESVTLTKNEVAHAEDKKHEVALYVVRQIELESESGKIIATEGEDEVYWPWDIKEGELTPTEYKYLLPTQ